MLGTATQTSEALQLQASGVHAVVAQGSEAGQARRASSASPSEPGSVGAPAA